jgi:hypothetical protein
MYRVFNHFKDYPPPYDGKPPAPLEEGKDYQTTWGASYYDSTWMGPIGNGAMEEDYEKACLPIFPIPNNYSCSVISLPGGGPTASTSGRVKLLHLDAVNRRRSASS